MQKKQSYELSIRLLRLDLVNDLTQNPIVELKSEFWKSTTANFYWWIFYKKKKSL